MDDDVRSIAWPALLGITKGMLDVYVMTEFALSTSSCIAFLLHSFYRVQLWILVCSCGCTLWCLWFGLCLLFSQQRTFKCIQRVLLMRQRMETKIKCVFKQNGEFLSCYLLFMIVWSHIETQSILIVILPQHVYLLQRRYSEMWNGHSGD